MAASYEKIGPPTLVPTVLITVAALWAPAIAMAIPQNVFAAVALLACLIGASRLFILARPIN